MKKSVFDYFAISAAAWYLAGQCFHYGSVWDSQANPMHDVQVSLKSGKSYKGTLSRDFDGNGVLLLSDGSEIRFRDDFVAEYASVPGQDSSDGFLRHWRSWLPAFVTIFLYMAWVFSTFVFPGSGRRRVPAPQRDVS